MAKDQPFLFPAACVLGAATFIGGYSLRGRTDAEARVARSDGFVGLVANQDPRSAPIPLGDFYAAMTDLLKREYVEPIRDDKKLASGAVRGMVQSLGDPRCAFMDPAEYRAFLNAREGRYEGIGVEFDLRGSASAPKRVQPGTEEPVDDPNEAALAGHVPYLVATMVVPNGPAARAGVRPGDVVSEVNGHWVVDDAEIARFKKAAADFAAHRIPYPTIAKMQRELRAKIERSLMPAKAKNRLTLGTTDTVNVVWTRAGAKRTTRIAKAPSATTAFGVKDGAYLIRFDAEAPARLRTAIKGKSSVILDLRNNVDGDFESMRKALAVVAPNGAYGSIATQRKGAAMPLTVKGGNARPPKISIRVDLTTRGPAAIFARALESRRLATLVGGPTGSDLSVKEVQSLPDGSGYTLVVGEYRTGDSSGRVALNDEVGS